MNDSPKPAVILAPLKFAFVSTSGFAPSILPKGVGSGFMLNLTFDETISPEGSSPITNISNSRLPDNSFIGLLKSNS